LKIHPRPAYQRVAAKNTAREESRTTGSMGKNCTRDCTRKKGGGGGGEGVPNAKKRKPVKNNVYGAGAGGQGKVRFGESETQRLGPTNRTSW